LRIYNGDTVSGDNSNSVSQKQQHYQIGWGMTAELPQKKFSKASQTDCKPYNLIRSERTTWTMSMKDFRRMAAVMDERVRQLTDNGVMGAELIHLMVGHLPDLQRIWTGTNDRQLAILCQDYPGFYRYASLMEEAAEAERANPREKFRDLPELDDSLKPLLAALLTDAATLERCYQSLIDDRNRPGLRRLTDELQESHRKWLADRKRFISNLEETDVPKIVLEMVNPSLDQLADRIAQLKLRVQRR